MSKKSSGDRQELLYTAVASALMLDFEHLSQIDLQQMAGVDEGNISRQIRNISDRVNRAYSIIRFNPIKVDGKEKSLIETEKLEEFNDLVEDFFSLQDLIKDAYDPDRANMGLWLTYKQVFIPKYEKQVNDFLAKEVGNQIWADMQHSDLYLRKFLLRKIMRLGYELQGQVALSLVQTLPREEMERLKRQLSQRKMEWE